MTVVCALRDGDDLYLAADSFVGGLPNKAYTCKIDYTERLPLAWSGAGDEAICDQMGRWIKSQVDDHDPESLKWDGVVAATVHHLAELNGIRVKASQLNHVTMDAGATLTQIIMVGFINGHPEIAHLEISGDWTLHLLAGRSFASLGSGGVHAAVAYELLRERGLLPASGEDQIREVTAIAARLSVNCSPPVHVAKITPTGVLPLWSQEVGQ